MRTYIITGANGFIGSRLVKKVAENTENTVVAVVRNYETNTCMFDGIDNIKVVYCSMNEYSALPQKIDGLNADCFIHLAWNGSTGSARADYEKQLLNIKNSIAAYKAAESLGCKRFLCAGTISENIIEQVGMLDSISQNMIYAQSKKTLYDFLNIFSKQSKMEFVWMQFSNVYGPHNTSGNLISYTFNEIDNDRIPEFGSGEQPYNFIYIDDLVNGIIALSNSKLTKNKYFIGSDEIMLLKDFLIKIPGIINKNVQIGIGRRNDDGIKYDSKWFDISDLKKDTGFVPEYSFDSGIKNTYNMR